MITQIVHLLQKRKPNAPPEWLKKIPDMARRLEDSLYRAANTREIYTDMKTLKHRLHGVTKTYQRQRNIDSKADLPAADLPGDLPGDLPTSSNSSNTLSKFKMASPFFLMILLLACNMWYNTYLSHKTHNEETENLMVSIYAVLVD